MALVRPGRTSGEGGQGQGTTQGSEQGGGTVRFPEPRFKGERVESRIHPDFGGLFMSAGFYGTGKTLIHLNGEEPQNICFVDMETKGREFAEQMGLENYFSPVEECIEVMGMQYTPLHLFQRVTQILMALPKDRFTWLLLDGGSILQEALVAEVERAPQNYGVRSLNIERKIYGGPYPGVNNILSKYLSMARSKGVKVVGMTYELKAVWAEGAPVLNKFKIGGVSALSKHSRLSVLMLPGYADQLGAPSGLVYKEALAKIEKGKVVRRLPVKLPRADMASVYQYLDRPADWSRPDPREVPTEEETKPYSSFVGKEQLGIIKAYLEAVRAGRLGEEGEGED